MYNEIETWIKGDKMPNKDNFLEVAYDFMIDRLKEKDLFQVYSNAVEGRNFDIKGKLSLGFHYLDRLEK